MVPQVWYEQFNGSDWWISSIRQVHLDIVEYSTSINHLITRYQLNDSRAPRISTRSLPSFLPSLSTSAKLSFQARNMSDTITKEVLDVSELKEGQM
jgi:hypothetical protein